MIPVFLEIRCRELTGVAVFTTCLIVCRLAVSGPGYELLLSSEVDENCSHFHYSSLDIWLLF